MYYIAASKVVNTFRVGSELMIILLADRLHVDLYMCKFDSIIMPNWQQLFSFS